MKTRNLLIILMGFLGLGAIGGGGVLIVSPSGRLMDMPHSVIQYSPFVNFLIPGIILFTLLGLMPVMLMYALIKKPKWRVLEYFNFFNDMHWAWSYTVYTGFALIIWIQTEMICMKSVHWSQSLYMGIALLILYVSLLPQVRLIYKK